jgi:riboflavin transporter 2
MFIVFFFFAIVSCTSSVLFMPYMGRFREIYLVTYIFGLDLSGLFTSLLVMVQGVGGEAKCILKNSTAGGEAIYKEYFPPPRFGVSVLYYFVAVLMVLSIVAFALLDRMKLCRNEHAAGTIENGNNYSYQISHPDCTKNVPQKADPTKVLSTFNFYYLQILHGLLLLFADAILPSIQSFSALPYGNTAFHLVVTLTIIACPVACFIPFFVPHHSIRQVTILTIVMSVLIAYAIIAALMSPRPPLVDSNVGVSLIVSIQTLGGWGLKIMLIDSNVANR